MSTVRFFPDEELTTQKGFEELTFYFKTLSVSQENLDWFEKMIGVYKERLAHHKEMIANNKAVIQEQLEWIKQIENYNKDIEWQSFVARQLKEQVEKLAEEFYEKLNN